MRVADLPHLLAVEHETEHLTNLGDLTYSNRTLHHPDFTCHVDEHGMRKLGRYLRIPITYLEKCPPDLQAHNINHWLQATPGAQTRVHILDGLLTGINPQEKTPLGVTHITAALQAAHHHDDPITGILYDGETLIADITSPHPVPHHGHTLHYGTRTTLHPHNPTPPTVQTLIHWPDTGANLTLDEPDGTTPLRDTTQGVTEELAATIRRILTRAPEHHATIQVATTTPLDTDPADTIAAITRTFRLPNRVAQHLNTAATNNHPTTPYQLAHTIAHAAQHRMTTKTRHHLQHIAGTTTTDPNHNPRNCPTCRTRETPTWSH